MFFQPLVAREEKGALILLYGTQCAGKSTLTKELRKTLPGHLKMVKRTPIALVFRKDFVEKITGIRPKTHQEVITMEENLPQEYKKKASKRFKTEALPPTIDMIRKYVREGRVVIFDVCIYRSEQIDLMKDLNPIEVLVYSPLKELSQREHARTLKEQRGEKAQMESRKYILNGFNLLYEPVNEKNSIDHLTHEEVMNYWHFGNHTYLDQDYLKIFQKTVSQFNLKQNSVVPIAPRRQPTVFIHTGIMSPQEGAKLVKKALIS